MSGYQGIIFDLDGVLVDTAELHFQAWKRLADRLGVPFDRQANERLKGVSRMASLDILLEPTGDRYGPVEREAMAAEKNADYVALIDTLSPSDLLPGARAALQACRSAGLGVALGSASRNSPKVLDRIGLAALFDAIVDPAGLAGKPAPDIFLKGAQMLKVPPHSCIGVEDAVAGVEAIKAAGMPAIGIGDPQRLTQADLVMPDLSHFNLADLPRAA
ncbi:MAG: beta-phosphoglucomutase [Rhodothalassiaceae bacterium]